MLRCRTERDTTGVKRLASLRWFLATQTNLHYLREMQKRYPNQVVEIYYGDELNSSRMIAIFKLDLSYETVRELNPTLM